MKKPVRHLFAKFAVAWCVFWGTACSVYALRIISRTGHDATGTLGVVLAFLGGELLFMCLRTILAEKPDGKKNETKPQEGQENKRDC